MTKTEKKVFLALATYLDVKCGLSPSYRTLAKLSNMKSTSQAHDVVRRLVEKGIVLKTENQASAVYLTARGQSVYDKWSSKKK